MLPPVSPASGPHSWAVLLSPGCLPELSHHCSHCLSSFALPVTSAQTDPLSSPACFSSPMIILLATLTASPLPVTTSGNSFSCQPGTCLSPTLTPTPQSTDWLSYHHTARITICNHYYGHWLKSQLHIITEISLTDPWANGLFIKFPAKFICRFFSYFLHEKKTLSLADFFSSTFCISSYESPLNELSLA